MRTILLVFFYCATLIGHLYFKTHNLDFLKKKTEVHFLGHDLDLDLEEQVVKQIVKEYLPRGYTLYVDFTSSLPAYYSGLTQDFGEGVLLVQIKNGYVTFSKGYAYEVLLHEMGHIIDVANGDLKWNSKGVIIWKGKKAKSLNWEERPWEISAMEWEIALNKKYPNPYLVNP